VGHCYDEGSFRPPYQPFVEVFATYLHGLDSEALHAELGSSAADLARIVPTLRERLQVSPPPPGDPEEDRWRLLQAATDLLHPPPQSNHCWWCSKTFTTPIAARSTCSSILPAICMAGEFW
jgi:hypothetical protein